LSFAVNPKPQNQTPSGCLKAGNLSLPGAAADQNHDSRMFALWTQREEVIPIAGDENRTVGMRVR